jgi:glutathione S-transferase
MITLYHAPRSRSASILWLLEELEAPYRVEITPIRRSGGEGAPAPESYRAIHPHLKVPAIEDDGEIVFEQAAIALYLTDAFPKNAIGPRVGEKGRGAYVTWLAYYAGVMEPAFIAKMMNWEYRYGTFGWAPVDDVVAHVRRTLEKGPYLLGERFSAADIFVGGAFILFMGGPLLPATPLLTQYTERLKARPAYQRALKVDEKFAS